MRIELHDRHPVVGADLEIQIVPFQETGAAVDHAADQVAVVGPVRRRTLVEALRSIGGQTAAAPNGGPSAAILRIVFPGENLTRVGDSRFSRETRRPATSPVRRIIELEDKPSASPHQRIASIQAVRIPSRVALSAVRIALGARGVPVEAVEEDQNRRHFAPCGS
jgi:hypothetical protein